MKSIYSQSLLPNEIILVKEGVLTPGLEEVLMNWESKLIYILRIVSVPDGIGFPASLNAGLKECKFEFVARMDTDDECVNDRFEKQILFFQKHQNIDLLGSNIDEYDNSLTKFLYKRQVPEKHEDILKFAKYRCPFNHMTVMYRRSKILKVNGYPALNRNEDYALWTLCLQAGYQAANISDSLVKARTGSNFIKRRAGIKYLKGEIESINFIYHSGFYSFWDFIVSLVIRIAVRLSPRILIKSIYHNFLR